MSIWAYIAVTVGASAMGYQLWAAFSKGDNQGKINWGYWNRGDDPIAFWWTVLVYGVSILGWLVITVTRGIRLKAN